LLLRPSAKNSKELLSDKKVDVMDPAVFNTDDITGVYPKQINEEDAWKIGCATARFLRSLLRGYERGQASTQSLCVGRDMRTHSEAMAKALTDGMNSTGANVIDIGMIDTPQMYFAINHLGTCGGVQVTASHNPAKYNGFRISGLNAKPIGADTGLKDIEHIATALLHTTRLDRRIQKSRVEVSQAKDKGEDKEDEDCHRCLQWNGRQDGAGNLRRAAHRNNRR
jgi:phosphomannomutase